MYTVLYETDYENEARVEWLLFKEQYSKKLRNLKKCESIAIKKHLRLSKIYLFYKREKLFSEQNLVDKLIPWLLMHNEAYYILSQWRFMKVICVGKNGVPSTINFSFLSISNYSLFSVSSLPPSMRTLFVNVPLFEKHLGQLLPYDMTTWQLVQTD